MLVLNASMECASSGVYGFQGGWLRGALGTRKRGCLGVLPKHRDWPLRCGWRLVGLIRASVGGRLVFSLLDHTLGSVAAVPGAPTPLLPKPGRTRNEPSLSRSGQLPGGGSGLAYPQGAATLEAWADIGEMLGPRGKAFQARLGLWCWVRAGPEPGPLYPMWLILKQPILPHLPPPPFHLGSSGPAGVSWSQRQVHKCECARPGSPVAVCGVHPSSDEAGQVPDRGNSHANTYLGLEVCCLTSQVGFS